MFVERYGERFKSRGLNLADAVDGMPLSMLQLRRFFAKYDTPAKAKEHLAELTAFAHESSERDHDARRVERCGNLLRQVTKE